MTGRERFQAALAHREGDRVPIHDGPWFTTEDRWHEEGLPADTTADEFFGYELAETWVGVGFKFPVETVEETEEYTLIRNSDGVLAKNWKHATSTPEWAEFSIRTRADWEEHKHEMVWTGEGVDWEAMRAAERRARERDEQQPADRRRRRRTLDPVPRHHGVLSWSASRHGFLHRFSR